MLLKCASYFFWISLLRTGHHDLSIKTVQCVLYEYWMNVGLGEIALIISSCLMYDDNLMTNFYIFILGLNFIVPQTQHRKTYGPISITLYLYITNIYVYIFIEYTL